MLAERCPGAFNPPGVYDSLLYDFIRFSNFIALYIRIINSKKFTSSESATGLHSSDGHYLQAPKIVNHFQLLSLSLLVP